LLVINATLSIIHTREVAQLFGQIWYVT